jgi:hypothetical protein
MCISVVTLKHNTLQSGGYYENKKQNGIDGYIDLDDFFDADDRNSARYQIRQRER